MRNEPTKSIPALHSGELAASSGVSDAVVGFCRFVRGRGHRIGVEETLAALQVARLGLLEREPSFRLALRALLCSSKEERDGFDSLFQSYWWGAPATGEPPKRLPVPGRLAPQSIRMPLLAAGAAGMESDPEEDGKSTGGASAEERLRRTDFSKVPRDDQARLEEIARRLWRRMSLRLSRRHKVSGVAERLDLRRTIRRSVACGGDPVELRFRGKRPRKPRLVLLLDVSGSMDQYSFFLLRFVYALQRHCRRVDSFAFSTRLIYITELLQDRKLDEVVKLVPEAAETWSSGTRMGDCLARFNREYSSKILSRRALVIVLSDGLDTGEPELLAREMAKIKRRTRKLIWLNPLLGMDGYQPLARGMQAALPMIDTFQSAHSLESLLGLENLLVDV